MEWKEVLAKFKLVGVDINQKVEGKQVGGINVYIENLNIGDKTEISFPVLGSDKLVAGDFNSPDFQKRVKKETERRLIELGVPPERLSESARTEIVTLTTASTAVSAIQLSARESMDRAEIVFKPESKETEE